MIANFDFRDVVYKKEQNGSGLLVAGEIFNRSGRNYHALVFRVVLFIRSTPVGNASFTINGFYTGSSKKFEKLIGDLDYNKIAKDITRHEIYAESGY